jgi:hypothetical protein
MTKTISAAEYNVYRYQWDQHGGGRIILDTRRLISPHDSEAAAKTVAGLRNQAAAEIDRPYIYLVEPSGS